MEINIKDLFRKTETVDDNVLQKLTLAIKTNVKNEFDYIKFKHAYKALCQMGIDENTAAKSAYTTASTMGLTKEKLLQSVQFYKQVLVKEKEHFASALKNQIAEKIDSKTLEINRLNTKYQENITLIEKINLEQTLIKEKIQELARAEEESKGKIEVTRDKFKSTYDIIFEEMENDEILFERIL